MRRPLQASAVPASAVTAVALAARLGLVLRGGGLRGSYGYDSSVYYAAAVAFVHGRMPYSDFVLIHPPAVMLALTPSALIGQLVSDHVGFLSATLLFTVLGAVNAGLVTTVARAYGLRSAAAVAGGLFYALWFGAVGAEYLDRLEPLGNLFLLLGLLAIRPVTAGTSGTADDDRRRRSRAGPVMLAGAALGLATSTKIWFAVPLLIVLGWAAAVHGRRQAARLAAGAALAAAVVDLPFLLLSHGLMWSRVVVDQLGRPRGVPLTTRIAALLSASRLHAAGHRGDPVLVPVAAAILAALVVVAVALAAQDRRTRLFAALALAQVGVLVVAPSWFGFYADFAAVPLALSVAGAAGSLRTGRAAAWSRGLAWSASGAVAAVTGTVLILGSYSATTPWGPTAALADAAADVRCVAADAPSALVAVNVLSVDMARGCPEWVDVTGRTYFGPDRAPVPRDRNTRWQADVRSYLGSGQAVLIVRADGDGLSSATRAALDRRGVLAGNGHLDLLRGRRGAFQRPMASGRHRRRRADDPDSH